jgi:hypothetical membrane protein
MTDVRPGRSGFVPLPAVGFVTQHGRRLASAAAWSVRTGRAVPAWAVVSAGLSPILLTGAWLIADRLQPTAYSPIRQTVSVMAGRGGSDRWIMTGALFLVGACYLVTAAGLTGLRGSARFLLLVAGLASMGVAASPEPVHGSTAPHLAWTALGAIAIAVWPAFVVRRPSLPTGILSVRAGAAMTAVSILLLGWLIIETRRGSALGLAERLSSSVQTSWPFIVALLLRRTPAASGVVAGAPCSAPVSRSPY